MKIYAPVKTATVTWASVRFVNGVGETDNPWLIQWFKEHGYQVEGSDVNYIKNPVDDKIERSDDKVEPDFEAMTPLELREWMRFNGYGSKIKNIRNKEKLLEIIRG